MGWTIAYRSDKGRYKRVSGASLPKEGAEMLAVRMKYLYPELDVIVLRTRKAEERILMSKYLQHLEGKMTLDEYVQKVNQLHRIDGKQIQEAGRLFDGVEIPTQEEIDAYQGNPKF